MKARVVFGTILIVAILAASVWSAWAQTPAGDEPRSASLSLEFVGRMGGPVTAVAVQEDYAYTGIGRRLVILDVTTPGTPTFVGQSAVLNDTVIDVAVAGNHAYVTTGDGLTMWPVGAADASQPRSSGPVQRGDDPTRSSDAGRDWGRPIQNLADHSDGKPHRVGEAFNLSEALDERPIGMAIEHE